MRLLNTFLTLILLLRSFAGRATAFTTTAEPACSRQQQCIHSNPPTFPRSFAPVSLFGKKEAREQGNERKSKSERVRKVKDDVIEIEGVVLDSLPNAMFRCSIDGAPDSQEPILATISGKIRKNFVKILVGDKVLIELSPYDLTRGRITFRYR